MNRNVEIKAKIKSMTDLLRLAREHTGQEGVVLHQKDTFYCCKTGRLKLREIQEEGKLRNQLIFYRRPDEDGPKVSDFCVTAVDDPAAMDRILTAAMGRKVNVVKRRLLFTIGQTRVHIDSVEGLGDFVELEVQLTEDQTAEDGAKVADRLMQVLQISEADLISGAYADLLIDLEAERTV